MSNFVEKNKRGKWPFFDKNHALTPLKDCKKRQYFCVFKYGRAVKQKVWNEAENIERDWGET